jgi:hypothetical protein
MSPAPLVAEQEEELVGEQVEGLAEGQVGELAAEEELVEAAVHGG